MNSYFGMATVCPPGYRPNKRYRAKRGQRQCLKGAPKKTLRELQAIAAANDVSIYKRRKDGMGFTRTPLTVKALKLRLSRMRVPYRQGDAPIPVVQGFPVFSGTTPFGKSTVCKPGYSPNPKWRRGQRQCLKDKVKHTLKKLQARARANDVSIYKRRKDDMGFTRTPLTAKALKFRLTKMKVPYA